MNKQEILSTFSPNRNNKTCFKWGHYKNIAVDFAIHFKSSFYTNKSQLSTLCFQTEWHRNAHKLLYKYSTFKSKILCLNIKEKWNVVKYVKLSIRTLLVKYHQTLFWPNKKQNVHATRVLASSSLFFSLNPSTFLYENQVRFNLFH